MLTTLHKLSYFCVWSQNTEIYILFLHFDEILQHIRYAGIIKKNSCFSIRLGLLVSVRSLILVQDTSQIFCVTFSFYKDLLSHSLCLPKSAVPVVIFCQSFVPLVHYAKIWHFGDIQHCHMQPAIFFPISYWHPL